MKITIHTESTCPTCGHHLDASACVSDPDATPREGDITICAYCASYLMYEKDMSFRLATAEDLRELPEPDRHLLATFRHHIQEFHREGESDEHSTPGAA